MEFKMVAELRWQRLFPVLNRRISSFLQAHKKRFYKNVDITPDPDGYLIQLDKKTIKTPLLNRLCAPSKPLALAIANEWYMQESEINRHAMPLTTICNTAIDNPTNISKSELANEILNFLHTDTICSLSEEPEKLALIQEEKWLPVRDWFSKRYNVNVSASANLFDLHQCDETISVLHKELLLLNKWQLYGLQTAIDGIKSFILPIAVIERQFSIKEAVDLSRLEVEFQIEKWGNVESVHDIDRYNQEAALAAGILFYQLSSDTNDVADTLNI